MPVSQRRTEHSVEYGPGQRTVPSGYREMSEALSHNGEGTVVINPQHFHFFILRLQPGEPIVGDILYQSDQPGEGVVDDKKN